MLDILVKNGISILAPCGKNGKCGKCKVKLISGRVGGENPDENGMIKSCKAYLTEDVFLSKRDISEFQLSKAAIMAGIKSLLDYCNADIKDITQLYLAGGMGYYINPQNAAITGLFPYELAYKSTATENTALLGAKLCLLSEQSQKEVEKIAADIGVVELSFLDNFQKEYTDNMFFE